jgi:hypothetical protein
MKTTSIIKGILVLTAATFIVVSNAHAQTSEQHVTITVRPAQTVEQRVADEIKEKELRKAAEEKAAAAESAKIVETSPKARLNRARTIYVESGTDCAQLHLSHHRPALKCRRRERQNGRHQQPCRRRKSRPGDHQQNQKRARRVGSQAGAKEAQG